MRLLCILCFSIIILKSCQTKQIDTHNIKTENICENRQAHAYGGWYCPDNILGFPAVNISDIDSIHAIRDRLPTKEETYQGKSLIFIDTTIYPNSKPIDIPLPQLARFSNPHTKKNELIIVIQAVDVDGDSIAGFRYINGGNGSAWLDEINFISSDESNAIGNTPFITKEIQMATPAEKIWDLLTSAEYTKTLGACFGDGYFIESDWQLGDNVHLKNEENEILSTGWVTASWENMYIQIDYNFSGYHYVEKYLIIENKGDNTVSLHLTTGPFSSDYSIKSTQWTSWLKKIKQLAENIEINQGQKIN